MTAIPQVKLLTLHFNHDLVSIDDSPLHAFLAGKQLIDLSHHFFTIHGTPHVTCLLTYTAPDTTSPPTPPKPPQTKRNRKPAPDPTAALTADQRLIYDSLSTWRKERAGHDGFPPYIIFSNRELAAIATLAPPTTTALQEIDGIGPAKAERYGKAVLARCHPNAPATTTEAKA